MNLYRSFGNLLETWVTDGIPSVDTQQEWNSRHQGTLTTASGSRLSSEAPMAIVTLRSESEDSGVELASSEASLLSPSCLLSLATTDTIPTSISPGSPPSPVLPPSSSSSSSSLCPSRTQGDSGQGSGVRGAKDYFMALHLKVEWALQRTAPGWKDPQSAGDNAVSRRQTHTASLPRDPTITMAPGQRSGRLGPRRAASQQGSEAHRRPLSLCHDPPATWTRTQGRRGDEWAGLSPGFSYLEQVCRLLEEMARLQQRNCRLQTEMDALRENQEQQGRQTSESLLCNCQAIGEDGSSNQREAFEDLSSNQTHDVKDLSSNQRCGVKDLSSNQRETVKDLSSNQTHDVKDLSSNQRPDVKDLSSNQRHVVKGLQCVPSETQCLDDIRHQAFRRRSASDTRILAGHLGKMKLSTRGQHASIDELLEQEDGWRNQQQDQQSKSRTWRLKLSSLRRDPAPQSDSETNRQQMRSCKKKASGHRLSQLFRRRRKTLPA